MRMAILLFLPLAMACTPQATDTGNIGNGVASTSATPSSSVEKRETPRYVGRWAASDKLCKDGVWTFAEMDLSTAGEVHCDFSDVRDAPGGYDIDAICTAEGMRNNDTIKLRFAESAGAMLVESKTFRPIGLIRCGGR